VPVLTDTTPDAQRVLDDCLRRMPAGRKWQVLLNLFRTARALHEAGFRMREPGATRRSIQADWRKMALGRLWQPCFAEIPEMDAASLEHLPILREVAAALTRLGINFALGGSWVSSMLGHARTTYDADITAEPFPGREAEFVAMFGPDYYVSAESIRDAIRGQSSFNVLHPPTGFKVDVFIRKNTPFGRSVLDRRRSAAIPGDPPLQIDVVSAEDIILLKLEWFRIGGETSDRQWNDVLGVLRVQAGRLDEAYLDQWAAELGVTDLLAKARSAAAPA
jgi:hypothetical protein